MKRFILLSLLLLACTEAPREAWDMPNTYTPNPANNPATITLPSPGDLVAAGVVGQAFKDTIDRDSRKLDKIDGGTVSGDLVTSGAVTIGGTGVFIVDSGVSEEHDNTPGFINGATFSAGGTVSCSVPSTFSDTATFTDVTQAIHSTGPVVIDGTNGSFYSGGTGGSQFATDVLIEGDFRFDGAGSLQMRALFPDGTGNVTTSIAAVDRVYYAALTGNRSIKLTNTGVGPAGSQQIEIAILPSAGAFDLTIKNNADATIGTLRGDAVSGSGYYAKCWHDGTNWFVAALVVTP